ncbi:hypothetical protein [Streptomyces zagrosensis]|uniref:Uncharacterized protein n=1 Tax=Streptomyces zagrosensis TaxID=1042984 RepID=A0A7W9V299_9ACTN|nr:hypothetical protein [Streptomyces zagrosensis]MBB5938624.1 hypothetical protein [Streptomyces zagrosensis]
MRLFQEVVVPPGIKFCYTCDTDEPHRPLTDNEKIWLKNQTGHKNVDGYFMCEAPKCQSAHRI